LPPLLGYSEFPGFGIATKNALNDLSAFENGGVSGVIFENNYDVPHKVLVSPPTISAMAFIGDRLRAKTKLPMGASVLWNDYRAALSIAKTIGLQFVRIPVFVDKVETDFGIVKGEPAKVLNFRKLINAENVAIFTDIHVKHAKLLSRSSLLESARKAIKKGSDALIITGEWTGRAPELEKVRALRKSVGNFPILIGSGVNKDNIKLLFQFANGAIVSTALKKGKKKAGERNVKPYRMRIDKRKVQSLVKEVQ